MFLQPRHSLFAWFSRVERLFGYETLHISVPSLPPGVIVSDPRNLDYIFKNEGTFEKGKNTGIFDKGEFFKSRSQDLFGYGIINADGELWKLQRRAGIQFLSKKNLGVLTNVALPEILNRSLGELGEVAQKKEVVDLQVVFHEITTQIMGRMAYNMEMHAEDDFTVAFEYASGVTAERFQNPLWFITEMFTGTKMRKALRLVKQQGECIVSSAVTDRNAKEKDLEQDKLEESSGSLIQALLDSIGDETLVADAALNYLSAGRDTVAQALTWAIYLLIQNPSVTEKLLQDITELQDPEDPESLTPTNLPYAHAIFNESLRLYPPIPFEIRQAQTATTLPDGTFLPASSIVVWCGWAMNRSYTTWGSDADVFRPERWIDDDGSVVKRGAAEFPVFNGGARACAGKQMAEIVAVQVIARLVRGFEFGSAWEGERVSRSSLTLPMEGGLPVYVKRRV